MSPVMMHSSCRATAMPPACAGAGRPLHHHTAPLPTHAAVHRLPCGMAPQGGPHGHPSWVTSASPFRAEDQSIDLDSRIASGEFSDTGSTKERLTRPLRKALAKDPIGPGRALSYKLAQLGSRWKWNAARRIPEARGDIREIVGQPVFLPLFSLFQRYGPVFRLTFGVKSFVIVSDPALAKQILSTNASNYSKGILSEILDFVMGQGLIPADGEVWKIRRRAIVPALHRQYLNSMLNMFGECSLHGAAVLSKAAEEGTMVEFENFFSRLALDIIGKAVFNYDFDSLTHDDPVIKAVYLTLREAEYRSTFPIPYWNSALLRQLVPRQREVQSALQLINRKLGELIENSRSLAEREDKAFEEEFLSRSDPSILHFLIAAGDDVTSKQLRDDLMTMLIAGHETTAAVLTWTLHCLATHPEAMARLQREVDEVLGDRLPALADYQALRYTTRVINEAMRLYPQPPVLIRRALGDDTLQGFRLPKGSDIFISVWNLHRSPAHWDRPEAFDPDRFDLAGPTPNEITTGFAYLPFGGGRRKCIGDQFALMESVVALAVLARRFDVAVPPDAPEVGMTTGATIHTANGLWLNVRPRSLARQETSVGEGEVAGLDTSMLVGK
ncbi:CYP97A5 [Auxenochlorella protothecoides x Auxenochlorella symbiontica]